MGFKDLFSRNDPDTAPANPELAELGREYAIAKRHGDRKTVNRITRTLGSDYADTDTSAVRQGRDEYDAIPPGYSKPRRRRT
ncbi:hypothetical protein ACIOUE_37815 [Streptomyces xanthochromogenes]|uniref:hypothetical protein n=1 Tax=Streptomyces xanthochromogenes TaxID=67384 RepID=UPI0037F60799